MAGRTYLNFILVVKKSCFRYRASVIESPAGKAATNFGFPFKTQDLENFHRRVGQSRQGVRRVDSLEMEMVRSYGTRLFQAVFRGDVYTKFQSSYDQVKLKGNGLRLQLRIDDPSLADLPWEYLYNPDSGLFLSLAVDTPVVHYPMSLEPVQPWKGASPLKILVVIANPKDLPSLDGAGEWKRLSEALSPLIDRCIVQVDRLKTCTLDALQKKLLSEGPYHVLHFIGHGTFDEKAQDGLLIFESQYHTRQDENGERLGTILHNHSSLRLAVLNACEGARTSEKDPFAGVAQSLIRQGLPAVIAMQYPITDQAAKVFSEVFYKALAEGYPIDAALAEARVNIFANGNDIEWGTPVLFMRSTDGKLFDFETKTTEPGQPTVQEPLMEQKELPAEKPISAVGSEPVRKTSKFWIAGIFIVFLLVGLIVFRRPLFSTFSPTPTSTQVSMILSPSPQPGLSSSTPSPTSKATHTPTLTTLPTSSRTPTPSITPRPILPYQVKQAITQEAILEMSNNPSSAAMDELFWPNAKVKDMSTGQEWDYADFYHQAHSTINENRHENVMITEFSTSQITLLTDNCRVIKKSGKEEPFGNILGDTWEFELREGIWKIANLWIENPPPVNTTYSFEDGTLGCWSISGEAGNLLGVSLVNSTDLKHDGSHSLALAFDLSTSPGEPRARIEHYASQPLKGVQKLSAWVYIAAESQLTPLEAQFFAWTTNDKWSVNQFQVVLPNTWTYLETYTFNPDISSTQVKMFGIEILLPAGNPTSSVTGIVFIDEFHIESNP
jgi:hypothetical protein